MRNENSQVPNSVPQTLEWIGGVDGHLRLIDQTKLPTQLVYLDCRDVEAVWQAIKQLSVRGAPAIGIAAAYGVCIGLQELKAAKESVYFARLDSV
jgi:methylthioribose-1-phosphate isomerase